MTMSPESRSQPPIFNKSEMKSLGSKNPQKPSTAELKKGNQTGISTVNQNSLEKLVSITTSPKNMPIAKT